MRREEFSFSGFEATQSAISKAAAGSKSVRPVDKPETFAEQITPSAREVFSIDQQTLESAGVESDNSAQTRVDAIRAGQRKGNLSDLQINPRALDNALGQPRELETTGPVAPIMDFRDSTLHNPNQYGSGHNITPKRELPPTPLATRSVKEEFGISEQTLLGRGNAVGVEDPRKYALREAVAPARGIQAEGDQMRILGKILPPARGPIPPRAESLSATEVKRLKATAENSLSFIQQELRRVERELASAKDKADSFRKTVERMSNATVKQTAEKELQKLVAQQQNFQDQLDILNRALAKKLPEYRVADELKDVT